MHVGVIGPLGSDSFADNILRCLPDLGVTAVHLGDPMPRPAGRLGFAAMSVAARAVPAFDAGVQRRLIGRARDARADVVISTDQRLLPHVVTDLRRGGSKVCLWFPDHVANVDRLHIFLGAYDALFFKNQVLVDRAVDIMRLPAFYLPEAANPYWHVPPPDAGHDPWIAVVGNIYPSRARLLRELLDHDIPLRLFGGPVPRWIDEPRLRACHAGHAVFRQDKARVFRRAAAVLNNLHPSEISGVNCRLFEAAGSGAAVLCESRPALAELFDSGREVFPFATFDGLVRTATELIGDRERGRAAGDAAAVRARRDHTYQRRLATLLEIVA